MCHFKWLDPRASHHQHEVVQGLQEGQELVELVVALVREEGLTSEEKEQVLLVDPAQGHQCVIKAPVLLVDSAVAGNLDQKNDAHADQV